MTTTAANGAEALSRLNADLGDRPIAEIKASELLDVLRKIERRGRYHTARRARSISGRVFRTGAPRRTPWLNRYRISSHAYAHGCAMRCSPASTFGTSTLPYHLGASAWLMRRTEAVSQHHFRNVRSGRINKSHHPSSNRRCHQRTARTPGIGGGSPVAPIHRSGPPACAVAPLVGDLSRPVLKAARSSLRQEPA